MGWQYSKLISSGLTNRNTEDIGDICSSKKKLQYEYRCSSFKCAGSNKNYIVKFKTHDWITNCPDCNQPLFSKRLKMENT